MDDSVHACAARFQASCACAVVLKGGRSAIGVFAMRNTHGRVPVQPPSKCARRILPTNTWTHLAWLDARRENQRKSPVVRMLIVPE